MEEIKKVYCKPELTVHGSIEEITLVNGSVQPTDTLNGRPGEAFPFS